MKSRIAQVIDHPLHRHLGIRTIDSTEGVGRLSITVDDNTVNPAGVFHGGVMYLLCDVCAYAGLLSVLESAQEAVTHDIHVSVMTTAKAGDVVTFSSRPAKIGRSIAFIDVEARVGASIIASARVTKTLMAI